MLKRLLRISYFAILLSVIMTGSASAYIDSSATAMLIQIAAGALISLGIVFGLFKQRIILFFKNLKVKKLQKQIEKETAKDI